MNFLEERIVKDGVVKEGNVLKVDSFLNHQMDIQLFELDLCQYFRHKKLNFILSTNTCRENVV